MEEGTRRGGAVAALLAVGALGIAAVPAYGALNGDSGSTATQQNAPGFVQGDERPERDKDCPWKDRGGRGGEGQGGGSQEGVSSESAAAY